MAARVNERGAGNIGSKTHTRTGTRKSRSGCAACKAKRLKCDETHPNCNQCTKRNRACPGYQKQYRWSVVHEKVLPPEQPVEFWPQAEHDALLNSLPQPQSNGGQGHASTLEQDCDETAVFDPALSSPLIVLPTPGTDDDVFFAEPSLGKGDDEDAAGAQDVATADDFVSWPVIAEHGWIDDPAIAQDHNTAISDIFADLCSASPSQVNREVVQEERNPAQSAIAITAPKTPKLLYTPVDLSTMLMEYWFSDVCPMWSAFDSPSNPHRQLASSAWQHSQAVYFALQSMSAACLVDSLPHVKKYISVLSSQAVEAIQLGVSAHKQLSCETKVTFPRELLLAIIAMGTSVCWSDTRQLGLWFLGKAHELLTQYEDEGVQLDASSRQELEYFHEALVYWEMLYRVVGSDPRGHLRDRRGVYKRRLWRAMSSDDSSQRPNPDFNLPRVPPSTASKNLTIHPWTGISTDIQHTFGLVALLCRDHRTAERKNDKRTTASLSDALCDIKMAQDLAHELAETNLYAGEHSTSPVTWSKGTGDSITPVQHLVDTAEAYRLAALLLLCQTFPDLDIEQSTTDDGEPSLDTLGATDGENANTSLALAMKLIETLRRVPAESGTRCIQPILYICAGAGMRFRAVPGESQLSSKDTEISNSAAYLRRTSSSGQSTSLDMALLLATHRPGVMDFKTASVTSCTLDVSRGRRFVVDRLCALQRSLPPRPIGVALDLVKTIWAEYDYHAAEEAPHWMDVMVDKGLQTLFG